MSKEQEREQQLEALWARYLAGETVAGEELAAEIRAGGSLGRALVADESLHRMLAALGRGAADEQAFVQRVEALTAAEASVERFVRAVDARIDAPKRRFARWALVFAPVALAAAVVAIYWGRTPSVDRPPVTRTAAPAQRPPTVVMGTLAAGGARLGPGQLAADGGSFTSDQGRACLRFDDGSRLCLEHGSRMTLPGGSAGRRVALEAGKAAVLVARRKAGPPFSVSTRAVEVTGAGAAFSVELDKDGAAAITRVVRGAVAVLPRAGGAAPAVMTVKAHEALSLASGAPWRLGADAERDEWSLLRGQTAAALALSAEPGETPVPVDPDHGTDPGPLLELADALRARGRLRDAQGICDQLARRFPGRPDVARVAAELRAPEPSRPWNATPAVYRINAGGARYVDPRGNVWSADRHFSGGKTAEFWEDIDGTDMDPLYRSERVVFPDDRLAYNLPVADGRYVVRLHFAEIWAGTLKRNMRKFDVLVEGEKVLASYDIAAEVGPMTATVKQVVTTVRDGSLDIDFRHVVENPKISGIEVLTLPEGTDPPPAPAPPAVYPPLPLPPTDALYRVNVAGREYVDPQGRRWEADNYFNDTGLGDAHNVDIAGTELDPVYQTYRYACRRKLVYHFPAPAGRYLVRLHFAELEPDAVAGSWVFGVLLEDVEVIKSMDIFAEVGANTALVKEVETMVEDGALDLSFRSITRCPKIAGIEVIPLE